MAVSMNAVYKLKTNRELSSLQQIASINLPSMLLLVSVISPLLSL